MSKDDTYQLALKIIQNRDNWVYKDNKVHDRCYYIKHLGVTEAYLKRDPIGAIDALGLFWDEEVRKLILREEATSKDLQVALRYTNLYQSEFLTELSESIKCHHKWQNYVGLNETFNYCEMCDVKQQ